MGIASRLPPATLSGPDTEQYNQSKWSPELPSTFKEDKMNENNNGEEIVTSQRDNDSREMETPRSCLNLKGF